jgi:Flp pilus assembly protein TadG
VTPGRVSIGGVGEVFSGFFADVLLMPALVPESRAEAARHPVRRVDRRRSGQSMVEFALVFPVAIVLFFMIIEGAFLLFSDATSHFAAGEAARQGAEGGNAATTDSKMVQVVRDSAVGQTTLETVNEIDIYRLNQDGSGNLTVDSGHVNKYRLDGTSIGAVNWPSITRDVSAGTSDYIGVTIDYTYNWRTSLFAPLAPPRLTAIYYVRLEPQTY